ncbi:glutathione peroxidase [Salibacter halophilus]|uniref:Glutathione peroxidase n=1 Tax=Salibacter halophilus TaxID=1803916 RepID=A0A6N6M7B8_9FLAO|nr:glutathione peroxidase [Salibacter halophilus]KAB1065958.1 glutathione peroxidase [Salibacter halophilus]
MAKTFHDFTVKDIEGKDVQLSDFKGKKLLVVNTASQCGLTPQYSVLQELYEEYGGDGFQIVGFPANNFGNQEPGTEDEIKTFCESNFNVTFPMMSKVSVKGDDQHEVYQWLTQKDENGVEDAPVEWNFQKFMIDENGQYVGHVHPQETPATDEIINFIKK